jgi:outer membrane protein OmpA-like peptidoglycan-associated protein
MSYSGSCWGSDVKDKSKIAIIGLIVALAGCESVLYKEDSQTGQKEIRKSTAGAGIGAATGGVLGAVFGGGKGAAIGAAAGAAAGGGIGLYMDKQERALREKLAGSGIEVERTSQDEIKLTMPGDITFDTGKSEVKENFFPTLQSFAGVLKEYLETRITIIGHTDSTGSLAFNDALSQDRARAVGQYLIYSGVDSSRLDMFGEGPRRPVATNATKEGRAQNRRVEFRLSAAQPEPVQPQTQPQPGPQLP